MGWDGPIRVQDLPEYLRPPPSMLQAAAPALPQPLPLAPPPPWQEPSPLEIDEPPDEAALCVVCVDARNTHACIPCGHKCVCGPCGRALQPRRCPLCRAMLKAIIEIF